jgi:hypothetical protein
VKGLLLRETGGRVSSPPPLAEFALEHLAIARHEEAEAEINRSGENIGFD